MMKYILTAAAVATAFTLMPTGHAEARTCHYAWAIPGTYTISGAFRGKVETAGAQLSRNCRINIRVPGVFSGTPVRRSGQCLKISFKIEGIKRAFSARWCNTVGYIPWDGRNIRARVKLVKRQRIGAGGG